MILKNGDYFVSQMPPYVSQFASKELITDMLDKETLLFEEDPKWKDFGFDTAQEYGFWCIRLCGIACTKMALLGLGVGNNSITMVNLVKRAIELGGYTVYDGEGNFVDKGWYYAPLVELAKEYGLNGKTYSYLNENELCANVLNDALSIVSVHPGVIRFAAKKCDVKGGHLVLVVGFRWDKDRCIGFYVHNPSGREPGTQEKAYVSIEQFREAFANRGFTIFA